MKNAGKKNGMRRIAVFLTAAILSAASGCGSQETDTAKSTNSAVNTSAEKNSAESTEETTEEVIVIGAEDTRTNFTPPAGSHKDSNGNYVDNQGNTCDKEDGSWAVPKGGHTDAKGRVYNEKGELMYGGAVAGSLG